MSIANVITLGLGPTGNLLVTLGYAAGAAPPPAVISSATPGRAPVHLYYAKVEDEEAKRRRRDSYIPRPAERPAPIELGRDYELQSARYGRALAKVQGEITRLRAQLAFEALQDEAAQLRMQQALQLAQIQEEFILEQIQVIDIAYVALVALTLQ